MGKRKKEIIFDAFQCPKCGHKTQLEAGRGHECPECGCPMQTERAIAHRDQKLLEPVACESNVEVGMCPDCGEPSERSRRCPACSEKYFSLHPMPSYNVAASGNRVGAANAEYQGDWFHG